VSSAKVALLLTDWSGCAAGVPITPSDALCLGQKHRRLDPHAVDLRRLHLRISLHQLLESSHVGDLQDDAHPVRAFRVTEDRAVTPAGSRISWSAPPGPLRAAGALDPQHRAPTTERPSARPAGPPACWIRSDMV
jgi:hypothetical protein